MGYVSGEQPKYNMVEQSPQGEGQLSYYGMFKDQMKKVEIAGAQRLVYKSDAEMVSGQYPLVRNQMTLKQYFANPRVCPIDENMVGTITRATVFGVEMFDPVLNIFLEPPMEVGVGQVEYVIKPFSSRPWDKKATPIIYPDDSEIIEEEVLIGDGSTDAPDVTGVTSHKHGVKGLKSTKKFVRTLNGYKGYVRERKYVVQDPVVHSSVSLQNYSREIPFRVSPKILRGYVNTPDMVATFMERTIASANATYANNIYVMGKIFALGQYRGQAEGVPPFTITTSSNLRSKFGNEVKFFDNGQLAVVDKLYGSTSEQQNDYRNLWHILVHYYTDSEFAELSNKYNPDGNYTKSSNIIIFLERGSYYDLFKKFYADTYHPDFIKLNDRVKVVFINHFPHVYPEFVNNTKVEQQEFKYRTSAVIMDERCFRICPFGQEVNVTSDYNPQSEATSYFIHYEGLMKFRNFYNRTYILTKQLKEEEEYDD